MKPCLATWSRSKLPPAPWSIDDKVDEGLGQGGLDVEAVHEGVHCGCFGDALAGVGKDVVVCEGGEHRAGAAHWERILLHSWRELGGAMGER